MRSLLALTAATLLTLSALTGCGGDSGDPGTNDTAPTFTVTSEQAQPITHVFTAAGTYTLTLKGDYAPTAPVSADLLDVWFSFSGQGSIVSGNDEPAYPIQSGNASTRIDQSITVTLTGAGPWQVTILCNSASASGTMTGLVLNTAKR
jgi:hypothetical protein